MSKVSEFRSAGNISTFITKSGDKWYGVDIKIKEIEKCKCAYLVKPTSVVFIPAHISVDSVYNVKVSACNYNNSGVAKIYACLIGKGGKIIEKSGIISISGRNISENMLKIRLGKTKAIPGSVFIKICRTKDSSGIILIKDIKYSIGKIHAKSINKESKKCAKIEKIKTVKLNRLDVDKVIKNIPKVSIIAYGSYEEMKRYCHRLFKHAQYPNYEIIIGTEMPDDGRCFREFHDIDIKNVNVDLCDNYSNINNKLYRHSSGDFLLFDSKLYDKNDFFICQMMINVRNSCVCIDGYEAFDRLLIRKDDFIGFANNLNSFINKIKLKTGKDVCFCDNIKYDYSFVTCTNNMSQYIKYVVISLINNISNYSYEIVPILNFGNEYSASQALNAGIRKSKADTVVLCHQDIIFYENWVDTLAKRINEIETDGYADHNWGVLGTAGITMREETAGIVYGISNSLQWKSYKKHDFLKVQTVDEHCMIINKKSGLKFDEDKFDGFHFYGADICLESINKGFVNYGIWCPLSHASGSSSMLSGKSEYMRYLKFLMKKWRDRFPKIRTPTACIYKGKITVLIDFK